MTSRLNRVEQTRAKKRIFILVVACVIIVGVLALLGVPLLVTTSVFLGDRKPVQVNTKDALAPFSPVIEAIPEATNSSTLIIQGYTEPEAHIQLFVDGQEKDTTGADINGSFIFPHFKLKSGSNTLSLIATDKDGNASQPTTSTIFFSTDAPKLEIAEPPPEGKKVTGVDKNFTILGITDPETEVLINDRLVSVSTDGSFRFSLALSDGENKIYIKATNLTGNQTETERIITYSSE